MEFKICTQCKESKAISEFNKAGFSKIGTQRHRGNCKLCEHAKAKEVYKDNKQWKDSFKTKCCKCGETRVHCLDYHHIDPEEKDYSLSDKPYASKEDFLLEIGKCIVLCSNCHRDFHFLEKGKGMKIENYVDNLELAHNADSY